MEDFSIESYMHKKDILDVRTLLLVNMSVSALMLYSGAFIVLLAIFFVALTAMLLFRMPKQAARYALAFALCHVAFLLPRWNVNIVFIQGLLSVLGFIFFMVARIIPLIMIAHVVIAKIPATSLVCALRKMGLHKGFVLSLTVALRFLPTARREMRMIRDCMKMRGIEASLGNFLKHPVMLIEYSLVPLLFRSLKISEEMTAAAMVKGVEYDGEKTSLADVRLSLCDALFAATAVLLIGGACIIEKNPRLIFGGTAV